MRTIIYLLIFCVLGWFLFTYRLLESPLGINGDEAVIASSAALIAQNGRDSEGRFLPVFTKIANSNDWKQPITVYSTVLVFKAFGTSYFNLKLVSVLFALISGILIFFLTKEIFNEKFALVSLLIYLTIPIVMIQSHLAMENIAPLPLITLWLWMLVKYSKVKKTIYLIIAALSLGVSIYSYLGLRLIMPVLTILSIIYIFFLNSAKSGKINLYPILIFILSLVPFLLFLLTLRNYYPGAVLAANRPQNFESYQQFLLPFISSFDLSFLFMKGDSTPYHSTGKEGMFLLATLPLFILGLFNIAKVRKHLYLFILAVFFFAPILYGLPGSIYRASRLLSLIPPFIVIAVLGFKSLFEIKKKAIKALFILTILVLVLMNYSIFLADYWFDYPQRANQSFEKPVHTVYKKAAEISEKENLKVFIHDDIPMRNPSAYSFFARAYLPNRLERWEENPVLPKRSITMVTEQVFARTIKGNKEVEVLEHGDMDLILVINRR